MRKSFLILACIGLLGSFSLTVAAQTPAASPAPALQGIKPNLAVGDVSAISQADNKISLQTSDGAIEVVLATTTAFKKVAADKPNLQAAVDSSVSEISVGDKLLVLGKVAADKKSVPAKTVYIMTKSDIAKRDTAERDAWRTRGVSGKVAKIDYAAKQITLAPRGMATTEVVITPKDNVKYSRYASDSNKFSDAKDSSLAEIKIGDEVRALGDKSEDGSSIKAEQIVSGSFKTVVGTITAIDAAKNEITIKEAQTGNTATVVVNTNSVLRKFPTEMATMIAGMGGGMRPAGTGQGGNQTGQNNPPQGSGQGRGQGQGTGRPEGGMRPGGGFGGGMRGGRGDLDTMLERLPTIALSDLKVGDAIGVSSTSGAEANRYTAIKLVSGIEPFIAAQTVGRGAGGRNQNISIDIPGLEGGFGEP